MPDLFTLTVEELEAIVTTGKYPEGMTFKGLAERSDLDKVFPLRDNPTRMAKYLLGPNFTPKITPSTPKEPKPPRMVHYQGVIPPEERTRRLQLKETEIALKEKKVEQLTLLAQEMVIMNKGFKHLNHRLDNIEKMLKSLVTFVLKKEAKNV